MLSRGVLKVTALLVLVVIIITAGFAVWFLRSDKLVVNQLLSQSSSLQIEVKSDLKLHNISYIPDSKFTSKLQQTAALIKKVQLNIYRKEEGNDFYLRKTVDPAVTDIVQTQYPVVFDDKTLGSYGYNFAAINDQLIIDIGLNDSKITEKRINNVLPLLILSIAQYSNSLKQPLLRPARVDFDSQLKSYGEIVKSRSGPYVLFKVSGI